MKHGSELIFEERMRQISDENFFAAHDDRHVHGELLAAALTYCDHVRFPNAHPTSFRLTWPMNWGVNWFKPTTPMRDLVKAGALISAEIDRRIRAGEAQ